MGQGLKGPQESPGFQDNVNPFLGEDADVEAGVRGVNVRRRPVDGGQEADWTEERLNDSWTSPRGPGASAPVGIIQDGPKWPSLMPRCSVTAATTMLALEPAGPVEPAGNKGCCVAWTSHSTDVGPPLYRQIRG